MIKKIRVKKEFTLDELMEDIFNDSDEIYEVEVEEEITEDMEFDRLVQIYDESYMLIHFSKSIREIKKRSTDKIYALINGELRLIWERE